MDGVVYTDLLDEGVTMQIDGVIYTGKGKEQQAG